MKQYLDLMRHVREHGTFKSDRTGTGTYSVFGAQMRFDLADGFPLVTTKKCHLKSIIHELLWMLKGDTNIKYLVENGIHIWTDWPLEDYNRSVMHGLTPMTRDEFEKELLDDPEFAETFGNLGPVYGYQWRNWPLGTEHMTFVNGKPVLMRDGIDQIAKLIEQIKTNPDSRRLIVSAWNPALIDEMKLPPCHALFQFYSREMTLEERLQWYHRETEHILLGSQDENFRHRVLDTQGVPRRKLSCQLYQRSADIFLGVPFNIASYALLTLMVAQVTDHAVGEFIWTGGDCHLYSNHLEQTDLQLSREPLPLPRMMINSAVKSIDGFVFEDFELVDYQAHPHIKAPVAV